MYNSTSKCAAHKDLESLIGLTEQIESRIPATYLQFEFHRTNRARIMQLKDRGEKNCDCDEHGRLEQRGHTVRDHKEGFHFSPLKPALVTAPLVAMQFNRISAVPPSKHQNHPGGKWKRWWRRTLVLRRLWNLFRTIWAKGITSAVWKVAEGCFVPQQKHSSEICQFHVTVKGQNTQWRLGTVWRYPGWRLQLSCKSSCICGIFGCINHAIVVIIKNFPNLGWIANYCVIVSQFIVLKLS